jgi:hypothetical protein
VLGLANQQLFSHIYRNEITWNIAYQNPGMVLNEQGSCRHLHGDALYLDWDTVLNEQGSDRCILSDALHRRLGVVKNKQEFSHLTQKYGG